MTAYPASRTDNTRNDFGATWAVPDVENLFLNPDASVPVTTAVYGPSVLPRLSGNTNQTFSQCRQGSRLFSTAGVADLLRPGAAVVDITAAIARCYHGGAASPSPSPTTALIATPSASPSVSYGGDVTNQCVVTPVCCHLYCILCLLLLLLLLLCMRCRKRLSLLTLVEGGFFRYRRLQVHIGVCHQHSSASVLRPGSPV